MELKMEHYKNTDLDAGQKIQSVYIVKNCTIEPVKKVLDDPYSVYDGSTLHISKVQLYLKISKKDLIRLNEALEKKRIVNEKIEIDVKKTIDDLNKIIILLESKMKAYKELIAKKNREIDISNLEKYFHDDPKLFESLIINTLQVFEEPNNNCVYGSLIRSTIKDLAYSQSMEKLNFRINQCCSSYKKTQERLLLFNKFSHAEAERDDLIKVQHSLENLSKLCSILKSKLVK